MKILPPYLNVLAKIEASPLSGFALRQFAMEQIATLSDFHWCGIYALFGDELRLDAFVGEATDHTRIKVGVGVCGTAVAENRNVIVDDVRELDNYLACSLKTRSELVVLIRDGETILGQIDIDGHTVGTFGPPEEALLTEISRILATKWAD